MLKIPEPTVFKHDSPVKSLLVLEKVVITGNDRGEIQIIEKSTFKLLQNLVIIDAPILKIAQKLSAIFV